jgi:hypothetical protein
MPHPVEHPDGHMRQSDSTIDHKPELCPPEAWQSSVAYLYGVDLYNFGYWWEAHEAWEGLWHPAGRESIQGEFLQALIQTTAAAIKLHTRRPRGVRVLLERAGGHFDHVRTTMGSDLYMGLNLAPWWDEVLAYYETALKRPNRALRHEQDRFPYIRLAVTENAEPDQSSGNSPSATSAS